MKRISLYKSALLLVTAVCFSLGSAAQGTVENGDVYQGKADIKASVRVVLKPGFSALKGCKVHAFIDGNSVNEPVIIYNPTPTVPISEVDPSGTSDGTNHIWSTVLRDYVSSEEGISTKERVETVQYFDGLGRLAQTVNVQGSPNKYDIVQPVVYDDFGRESVKYLPFVAGQDGAYIASAATVCNTFYASAIAGHDPDAIPYSTTLYDNSPLNRAVGEIGIGATWAEHPSTIGYKTNTSAVPGWDVVNGTPATYTPDNYQVSSLYLTESTDENGNVSREYKDKLGNIVCKEAVEGANTLSTYYIYDDFNLLRCVVPPLAEGPGDTELCYFYTYDEKKRMVEKKLPGADPVYMVYDKRDRLAMTQDGNNRNNTPKKWNFTLYDAFNRPVVTGILNSEDSWSTVQGNFRSDPGVLFEQFATTNAIYGYSGASMPEAYPVLSPNVQTVTWYDDYNFLSNPTFISTQGSGYAYQAPHLAGNPSAPSEATKTLVTGTLAKVLTNTEDNIADDQLITVNYYDDYGRVIQTIADNHLGGKDITSIQYNFSGQVLTSVLTHNVPNKSELKYSQSLKYDHQGRLLSEKVKVNDQAEITLTANEYNKLGEVVAKYYHGNSSGNGFNQKVDYSYNIRGWLRRINTPGSLNSDLFALILNYETLTIGNGLTADATYNGNISQMRWQTTGNGPKGYGFKYDRLNRLETATYADGTSFNSNANNFDTSYGYDKNGNIKILNRKKDGTPIDKLVYTYLLDNKSNQLKSVTDGAEGTANAAKGYQAMNGDYLYDNNGNMTSDPSKGTAIDYNYLNLPKTVSFGGDNEIRYVYDATGAKHIKAVDGSGADNDKRVHYSGPFLYEDNDLKCIFTSAGRIVPVNVDGSVLYKFEYNLNDHLGNVRVSFGGHSNGNPEIMQVTDYYPFGMVMTQQNFVGAENALQNKYLYNGKELQDDNLAGAILDWYDYGARFYDPMIGRFHTPDRFAEKYLDFSPYQYAANNPIKYIDVNGDSIWIQNRGERILYENGNLSNADGSAYAGKSLKVNKDGTTRLKGFVGKTVSALNAASEGEAGNSMIDELQSSSDNVSIVRSTEGNSYQPGTNTVKFDPSSKNGGLNTRGATDRPTFIGLGHELAHGLDDIRGTLNLTRISGQTFTYAEHFSTNIENQMRAENGLPLRTHYGINPNTSTGIYPLINATGQSLYYGGYSYYGGLKLAPRRALIPVTTITPGLITK